ncbi:putative membrane protein [Wickerhamomyces ciferrii]|uniref:Membrane protein n=1 Tax=Wickerhamomyces ciferrii (strain ATCC 14091 / BCRC 22168 / CBS 111 / JCM 3599 / NBRC 0793 / NRRL Y-1031 F-60-10) TaxID=1206466 RepID=K0KZT6_WICCF|nr:uncharacterized protein BN7_6456 [Wickerhamomyces ciferrii]CCH46854.1 putative membrane protein [Wickerhamomyces ciferrii]
MNKPPRINHASHSLAKLSLVLSILPKLTTSIPLSLLEFNKRDHVEAVKETITPQEFWINMMISIVLVLAGGVFAGLTLGLMGQDEVYLKVISTSGDAIEQKNAKKVLKLIDRGKHWVLVTLLLSNVITNETLPIVLDRCLGGGWPAVVSSTVAIVIFGEVIPQSISVRYGLQVGAFFTPFVLGLMYFMYPVAYPIACLLDRILGEDHGTIYKKSGLKTLVTLHRTMGVERLNNDEVTIISAVLDLKEKKVHEIMTPLQNVYTMSSDRILDEKCVEEIFNSGFSRIPIHLPNEPKNFIGMLLVRVLISYDPEDALPVSSFPLATLPETPPETSCLNILNYFQEGKSHMVVVSENPGDSDGSLGVLTLEDVIEELIGEEIVDESDVFIDIHKNIKRTQPGPLSKRHLTQYLHSIYHNSNRNSLDNNSTIDNLPNYIMKDHNNNVNHGAEVLTSIVPSNLASNPLETSKPFVTIKKQPQPTRPITPLRYDYQDDHIVNNSSNTPLSRSQSPNYGSASISINETSGGISGSGKKNPIKQHIPKKKTFQIPISNEERNSTDLSEFSKTKYTNQFLEDNENSTKLDQQYEHSYRTGGIIESVVEVDGVSKTIIESAHDSDDEDQDKSIKGYLVDEESDSNRLLDDIGR